MELNIKNITFIIVTFKSEKVIHECINSLPKDSHKIIIENSNNQYLMKELTSKYDNIEVILSENLGMGSSNNIGLKKCKTQFAFIINPDIRLENTTVDEIIKSSKLIEDFTILSPLNSDINFPNYLEEEKNFGINENILSVKHIDGFSMLINREKFSSEEYFDENFFLFLENNDLCLRVKKRNEKLYIIKNSKIIHLRGKSSDDKYSKELEYLRSWHWMWSKFYYNKKHYGYIYALYKTIKNFISSNIKFLLYLFIFNHHKRKISQRRISGLLNSMFGKKSWYRLNN